MNKCRLFSHLLCVAAVVTLSVHGSGAQDLIKQSSSVIADEAVKLEIKQRRFLVGEPIVVNVGVCNTSARPLKVSLNGLVVVMKSSTGLISLSPLNICGDDDAMINPGQTVWKTVDLSDFSGIDHAGAFQICARLDGYRYTSGGVSRAGKSFSVIVSSTTEVHLVEPEGENAIALDWLRNETNVAAMTIESPTESAKRRTRLSQTLQQRYDYVLRHLRGTIYANYATLYSLRNDLRFLSPQRSRMSGKEFDYIVNECQEIIKTNPDSWLADTLRLHLAKCKVTFFSNEADTDSFVRQLSGASGKYASQEMAKILSAMPSEK